MPSSMGFMSPWLTCIPSPGRIHVSPGHMKTIARRIHVSMAHTFSSGRGIRGCLCRMNSIGDGIRVSMAHMHGVDRHVNSTIVFAGPAKH